MPGLSAEKHTRGQMYNVVVLSHKADVRDPQHLWQLRSFKLAHAMCHLCTLHIVNMCASLPLFQYSVGKVACMHNNLQCHDVDVKLRGLLGSCSYSS